MARGRPIEWTEEKIKEAKELYLQLLAQGKTEEEINECDGVPSWAYRYKWRKDADFLTECQEAVEIGTEKELYELERLHKEILQRACDSEIPPHAVTAAENIAKHKRWKAGKRTKTYAERTNIDLKAEVDIGVSLERALKRAKAEE